MEWQQFICRCAHGRADGGVAAWSPWHILSNADSALTSLQATRAEPYQNTGKSVPGSFPSFSTEKLTQWGFKWPVPVIKRVPKKGDSGTGTPWGKDTNPSTKELTGGWEHMQEATNTTSQRSWASLCRPEDRDRCGKHLGEGLFVEDRSSPGELTTPTLRPWLCVKAFTTLCLQFFVTCQFLLPEHEFHEVDVEGISILVVPPGI